MKKYSWKSTVEKKLVEKVYLPFPITIVVLVLDHEVPKKRSKLLHFDKGCFKASPSINLLISKYYCVFDNCAAPKLLRTCAIIHKQSEFLSYSEWFSIFDNKEIHLTRQYKLCGIILNQKL